MPRRPRFERARRRRPRWSPDPGGYGRDPAPPRRPAGPAQAERGTTWASAPTQGTPGPGGAGPRRETAVQSARSGAVPGVKTVLGPRSQRRRRMARSRGPRPLRGRRARPRALGPRRARLMAGGPNPPSACPPGRRPRFQPDWRYRGGEPRSLFTSADRAAASRSPQPERLSTTSIYREARRLGDRSRSRHGPNGVPPWRYHRCPRPRRRRRARPQQRCLHSRAARLTNDP